MTEDFEDKLIQAALKAQFGQVVEKSLREILGESGARAAIYHLGSENLQNPQLFEERLKVIFGEGSTIIFEHILRNMKCSAPLDQVR